jgi:aminotransferase
MSRIDFRSKVSQRVAKFPSSGIRKFFDLISEVEGVVSLGVGEPDFVTPWHIREKAIRSLEEGYTMYTSNSGLSDLRMAISSWLKSHYGLSYDPQKEVLVTVGVSEGLDLATRAILDPQDEVILPDPSYVSYAPCVLLVGGIPVFVPTSPEDEFKLQAEEVEARITPATRAILLGYPANPTGAVMERQDLLSIAEVVRSYNLMVISDEIYSQLVYDGVEHVPFALLPGMRERTILLGGLSKAYAMTGWRIGYACGPEEIVQAMIKIHQYTILCAPIMGQKAAIEALREGEESVQQMVKEYDHRRHFLFSGLRDIGLPCVEPRGAFYAFPSIKDTHLSSEEFAQKLLLEEKVAVVPGSAFGDSGEGYIRLCYATSLSTLEEALKRIGRFVGRLHA